MTEQTPYMLLDAIRPDLRKRSGDQIGTVRVSSRGKVRQMEMHLGQNENKTET